MARRIVAGLDGSAESLAAVNWAVGEAALRELPLRLVHVWEPVPVGYLPLSAAPSAPPDRVAEATAARLQEQHPQLEVEAQELAEHPVTVLADAADEAELLVLGSRGRGGLAGFLVGSVSLGVVARVSRPVVLVRADQPERQSSDPASDPASSSAGDQSDDRTGPRPASGQPTTPRPGDDAGPDAADCNHPQPDGPRPDGPDGAPPTEIVVGVKLEHADEPCVEFAFDEARRRGALLRVVHTWNHPPVYGYAAGEVSPDLLTEQAQRETRSLRDSLAPWRRRFPEVQVLESVESGRAGDHLVAASSRAALVVVGRRARHSLIGSRLGPVVHSVIHHSVAPTAIVPRG